MTTYCRSHTASKRSVEELACLKAAGLDRVHIGLETGSKAVIEFVQKGGTEVQGKLPEDKEAMNSAIDRFLALSDELLKRRAD